MKKLFMIAAIALLGGMMTACSSDEDEFDTEQVEPALRPLLGYWQYTGPTYDSQVGYIFKSSGEVVRWSIDHSADGCEYKERHFGTYGIDDKQHYYLKGDSKENMTEGAMGPAPSVHDRRIDANTLKGCGTSDLCDPKT